MEDKKHYLAIRKKKQPTEFIRMALVRYEQKNDRFILLKFRKNGTWYDTWANPDNDILSEVLKINYRIVPIDKKKVFEIML